jgi:UDP-N-acetylmuramyl-tripeptide synthetase
MHIDQLITDLPIRLVYGDKTLQIDDICEDSRLATPGCFFIARSGTTTDGARYIADAIAAGAVAVLCESIPDNAAKTVAWLTADKVDNQLTGMLAEAFFEHPSRKLRLIGITGTNGKTTTAYLTRRLLRRSGIMCGMIGTIEIDDGINRTTASLTTPGSVELSRLLGQMVNNGCTAAVMEVSSHALDQGRAAALDFHVGIFTNLTGDHLDYHGTMANYATAKAKLFTELGSTDWAVLNMDDPYSQEMAAHCNARKLWCQVCDVTPVAPMLEDEDSESICTATMLQMTSAQSLARLQGPWGSVELNLPMIGKHNLHNVIQAIAAANCITAVARKLRPALEQAKGVPGRLELVTIDAQQALPTVLVDYAHTHDALENVLAAIKPLCTGKLICVFGCGGDRDATKRPKMAKIACDYSDIAIITSDNPRTENPMKIMDDIQAGVPADTSCDVRVIDDRHQAIEQAIQLANPQDTILIAGKGHEDYQIIGTEKTHFDDREIAAQCLMNHKSGASC